MAKTRWPLLLSLYFTLCRSGRPSFFLFTQCHPYDTFVMLGSVQSTPRGCDAPSPGPIAFLSLTWAGPGLGASTSCLLHPACGALAAVDGMFRVFPSPGFSAVWLVRRPYSSGPPSPHRVIMPARDVGVSAPHVCGYFRLHLAWHPIFPPCILDFWLGWAPTTQVTPSHSATSPHPFPLLWFSRLCLTFSTTLTPLVF